MEPTDMDLREASAWWSPTPTTLELSRAEKAALVAALEWYDVELEERLKSGETWQIKPTQSAQKHIAELLLKLGA